jgi:hypothetical protein
MELSIEFPVLAPKIREQCAAGRTSNPRRPRVDLDIADDPAAAISKP